MKMTMFKATSLTLRRARIKPLFSLWFFSKSEFVRREVFGRLESQFETLSAPVFWLRFDRQVSRISEGKNRHRDIRITSPAEGLTLRELIKTTLTPWIGYYKTNWLNLVTLSIAKNDYLQLQRLINSGDTLIASIQGAEISSAKSLFISVILLLIFLF